MHPHPLRLLALAILGLSAASTPAATITWAAPSGTWSENGTTLFWNPADEPDPDDTARFNTDVAVTLGSANTVGGLLMSASASLNTNGHDLTISGTTLIGGTGTTLTVTANSGVASGDLSLTSGGLLQMSGGGLLVEVEKTPNGLLTIGAGATLQGFGGIGLFDTPASVTALMRNDGTLRAVRPPPPATFPPG